MLTYPITTYYHAYIHTLDLLYLQEKGWEGGVCMYVCTYCDSMYLSKYECMYLSSREYILLHLTPPSW